MRSAPTGLGEIDQALEALSLIARMSGQGREVFDASEDRRLALAYLWVNVGSALKQFCRLRGIEQGSSPFPGPIRIRDRLCYKPPSTLSVRVLWETCTQDTEELNSLLADLRDAVRDAS